MWLLHTFLLAFVFSILPELNVAKKYKVLRAYVDYRNAKQSCAGHGRRHLAEASTGTILVAIKQSLTTSWFSGIAIGAKKIPAGFTVYYRNKEDNTCCIMQRDQAELNCELELCNASVQGQVCKKPRALTSRN